MISTTSQKLGMWILWNCVDCLDFFKCYRNIKVLIVDIFFLLTQAVHLSQWIPWPPMHISLAELPTAPHPLDHHQPWKPRHHLLALLYPVPHLYRQRQMVNICTIKLALTALKANIWTHFCFRYKSRMEEVHICLFCMSCVTWSNYLHVFTYYLLSTVAGWSCR